MKRPHAVLLLALLLASGSVGSLFSWRMRERTYPRHRVTVEGSPDEAFVALRTSWIGGTTFADGKGGWFCTTYEGPVELVTRSRAGLVRRRGFVAQVEGRHRSPAVTVRLGRAKGTARRPPSASGR